jgi:hypothetical protein
MKDVAKVMNMAAAAMFRQKAVEVNKVVRALAAELLTDGQKERCDVKVDFTCTVSLCPKEEE